MNNEGYTIAQNNENITEVFDNIYKIGTKLVTKNFVKGHKVYGEELITYKDIEYRMWNPYRSKLAAAILNNLKEVKIQPGSKVLYLGAANGTTPSHVSDIISRTGRVYCVEISKRSMRDLVEVCELRNNMLPILSDAMEVDNYSKIIPDESCDVIYQDASARDQAGILIKNTRFLKKGGYAYFIIKSQSIDVGKNPKDVFKSELEKLKDLYEVKEKIDLNPFDKLHMFAVLQKK